MIVKAEEAEAFEAEARRQIEVVTEREMGTICYGFLRRPGNASEVLPAASANFVEYIHPQAYKDEDAQKLHLEIEFNPDAEWAWGRIFRPYMNGPNAREVFDAMSVVAGISRAYDWTTGSVHCLGIERLIAKPGSRDELEAALTKHMQNVQQTEPGALLSVFLRRAAGGSALIPQPKDGDAEYLQVTAYVDAAAKAKHQESDLDHFWARRFGPEKVAGAFMTAVSRDAFWSPSTP
jgi:hypothetical protein